MPPGGAGRLALRDATACGGRWYVVGAVIGQDAKAGGGAAAPGGATRPAAWTSRDGRTWRPLRLTPHSTYGQVALLYAAGCRDGVLAVIGAQRGGAHGNPRVTQWRLLPDGTLSSPPPSPPGPPPLTSASPSPSGLPSLDEVPAAFELYGGPDAVNVGRIAGGPAGWLIAGNRVGGAAAWVAGPDATGFRLVDRAPGLASGGGLDTVATDAAAYQGSWVVVGGGRRAGQRGGDPMAWTSADGLTWQRMTVPEADGDQYRILQRVVASGDALVAAGLDGDRFGAWRLAGGGSPGTGGDDLRTGGGSRGTGGEWRPAGRFGAMAGQLTGLAAADGKVWATGVDGRKYAMWASSDGDGAWRRVELPLALAAAGADHALTVAGAGRTLLVVADDGQRGRAWVAG